MKRAFTFVLLSFIMATVLPVPAEAEETAVPTIAVMPFSNLNKNQETDWLSEGVAETLTTKLGTVKKIRLVERQRIDSVLKEVSLGQSGAIDPETAAKAGKVLGAETVVTGAYQKMGENLRLTARFVKVETGIISNTAMVTGLYNDIFDLEDDIADKILTNLGIQASATEKQKISQNPTTSVAAYKNYTQGVSLMKQDRYEDAKTYLDQAIKEDPNFNQAKEDLAFVNWARPSANSSLYLKKIDKPFNTAFDAMIRALPQAGLEVRGVNKKKGTILAHQSMSLLHGGHDMEIEIKNLKNASGVRIFAQAEENPFGQCLPGFLPKRPVFDWGQSRGAIEKLIGAFELELYRRGT